MGPDVKIGKWRWSGRSQLPFYTPGKRETDKGQCVLKVWFSDADGDAAIAAVDARG